MRLRLRGSASALPRAHPPASTRCSERERRAGDWPLTTPLPRKNDAGPPHDREPSVVPYHRGVKRPDETLLPVVVVGGGVTGLAAAHALHAAGIAFRLVESAPRLGGVIDTERAEGFLMEVGPDTILAQKPEGVALCREIGLGPRLVPTNPEHRTVHILVGGRLRPLPEGLMLAVPTKIVPFLKSDLFTWWGKLRMGLDLVRPGRKEDGDESIASFLRRRFGQEAVDRIGEPLLAGIHSGDPERLSMLATFPRFVALERKHGSLIRGMWATPRPAHTGPAPAAFYSLAEGLAVLPRTLARILPPEALIVGRAAVASSVRAAPGVFASRETTRSVPGR